ncbi:MAG: VWA domain-containing protein [Acidobacteria bacterium]|nr:VWA domain-containing protein [Acidobacteriota bacterium]
MLDFISSKQVVLSVFLLALCSTLGYAQQGTPAQFRTEVEQVVLYASVYDKDSILVADLKKEDFTIYEDRIQQEVTYFGRDDVPSTVGVVIDSSGSMRDKFDLVNDATRLFLSKNNPENELFFVAFKDEVRLEQDFTRDVEDIYDALDNVIISGGTALYDAIYLAVDKVLQGNEPKKAVIVFTDGEDKDSYYSHEELIEKVEESDVQLYIVAFLDSDLSRGGGFFGVFKSAREKIQQKIRDIPQSTGGEAFFPEEISQLNDVFHSIAYELRNQYRLSYVSSNPIRDGTWRRTDVVVKDAKERGFRVRAKKGYFAKKDPTPSSQN